MSSISNNLTSTLPKLVPKKHLLNTVLMWSTRHTRHTDVAAVSSIQQLLLDVHLVAIGYTERSIKDVVTMTWNQRIMPATASYADPLLKRVAYHIICNDSCGNCAEKTTWWHLAAIVLHSSRFLVRLEKCRTSWHCCKWFFAGVQYTGFKSFMLYNGKSRNVTKRKSCIEAYHTE